MRIVSIAAAALCLAAASASAEDCQVEDWRWYHTPMVNMFTVEGVASCDNGRIAMLAYDQNGESRKFLGVADSFIEHRAFVMTIYDVDPPPVSPAPEFTITEVGEW